MRKYTPFNKSLEDLETADLATLKDVSEGWYVEYKQKLTDGKSIAKSLSALANTYGGWLFYGVKEESKHNSVADEFPGIPTIQIDAAQQTIRSAAAKHMNPSCHFEIKILNGPCTAINLDADHAIICVTVPQSIEAPHIHESGRIYRRVADASDPVPETDRYMVDKLFQRSQKKIDYYKRWHDKDPEFSKAESKSPYIRIMIEPNLWDLPRPPFHLTTEVLRSTLNPKTPRKCVVPFDTVYSRSGGFIARQCINNDPNGSTLTWDVGNDLSGDVLVPLNSKQDRLEGIGKFLSHYEQTKTFLAALEKFRFEHPYIIDLNHIFNMLMSVIETQQALQKLAGWPTEFNIKFKILNAWRTIPFVDTKYFVDYMSENGIPMLLSETATAPMGTTPDSFILINNIDTETEEMNLIRQAIISFLPITTAFGLPFYQMATDDELVKLENKTVYSYFVEAGNRAGKRTW